MFLFYIFICMLALLLVLIGQLNVFSTLTLFFIQTYTHVFILLSLLPYSISFTFFPFHPSSISFYFFLSHPNSILLFSTLYLHAAASAAWYLSWLELKMLRFLGDFFFLFVSIFWRGGGIEYILSLLLLLLLWLSDIFAYNLCIHYNGFFSSYKQSWSVYNSCHFIVFLKQYKD